MGYGVHCSCMEIHFVVFDQNDIDDDNDDADDDTAKWK